MKLLHYKELVRSEQSSREFAPLPPIYGRLKGLIAHDNSVAPETFLPGRSNSPPSRNDYSLEGTVAEAEV